MLFQFKIQEKSDAIFHFLTNSFASDVIYQVQKPEIISFLPLKYLFYASYSINLQIFNHFCDIFNNSKFFEIFFVT